MPPTLALWVDWAAVAWSPCSPKARSRGALLVALHLAHPTARRTASAASAASGAGWQSARVLVCVLHVPPRPSATCPRHARTPATPRSPRHVATQISGSAQGLPPQGGGVKRFNPLPPIGAVIFRPTTRTLEAVRRRTHPVHGLAPDRIAGERRRPPRGPRAPNRPRTTCLTFLRHVATPPTRPECASGWLTLRYLES